MLVGKVLLPLFCTNTIYICLQRGVDFFSLHDASIVFAIWYSVKVLQGTFPLTQPFPRLHLHNSTTLIVAFQAASNFVGADASVAPGVDLDNKDASVNRIELCIELMSILMYSFAEIKTHCRKMILTVA
jgi:hypothetical protein